MSGFKPRSRYESGGDPPGRHNRARGDPRAVTRSDKEVAVVHRFATDAEAWAELDRLLDEALDLPAPQRAGWIEASRPDSTS